MRPGAGGVFGFVEITMVSPAKPLQGLCHAGKETCSRHVAGGYIDVQALQLSAEGAMGPVGTGEWRGLFEH